MPRPHPALTILVFGVLFAVLPFFLRQISIHISLLLCLVAAGLGLKLSWRNAGFLLPPLAIILIGASSWLFSNTAGRLLASIPTPFGIWEINSGELYMAARITLRSLIWLVSFTILLGSMTPREALVGLTFLRLPRSIGVAAVFAFALWPYLLRDVRMIVEAQEARGLDIQHGWRWKHLWLRMYSMTVPLLFVMFRRSRTMTYTLIVRGWGAPARPTDFYRRPFRKFDWQLGIGALIVAACAVWIDQVV